MKKILLATFLFFTIESFAQKDSTAKDSVKTFAIILTEPELKNLVSLLKTADEKPSVINEWLNFLNTRIQILQPPANKEQPKK